MELFWDLGIKDKKAFIEELLESDNTILYSLSNKVREVRGLIIKEFILVESCQKEYIILKNIGRRSFMLENILIIDKIEGNVLKKKDINIGIIKKIKDNINNLGKSNHSNLKTFDFSKKIRKNENEINSFLNNEKMSLPLLEKTLKVLSNDFVVSHGDLNSENIIIEKQGKIYLIDFEEACITTKYFDWIAFNISFALEREMVNFICKINNLDEEVFLTSSILQGILMFNWNKKNFGKYNNPKYLNKANEIRLRIIEIYQELKITHYN